MALTDAPLFTATYYGESGGATTYYYWLQIKYPTGDTGPFAASPVGIVTKGLSHNNVVALNWTAMPDAVSYSIYRNTSNSAPSIPTSAVPATALCIATMLPTADGLVDNGLPTFTITPSASTTH